MKKTLSILIISLAFLSCEKEKAGPAHETTPIEFGNIETRAAITEDNFSSEFTEFGVFAYMNGGADGTAEASVYSPILEDERVYKNGDEWLYGNTRYWVPDRTFQFFAFFPYQEDFVSHVQNNANHTGHQLTFTTPADADVDLMTAHKTVSTAESTPTRVELAFKHELVQVNVEVTQNFDKNPNQEFCVNSITLSNVRGKGTLTTSTLGENAAHNWTIDGSASPMSFSYSDDTDTPIRDITGDVVKLSPANLLLIPQAAGAINLAINYKYGTYTDDVLTWQDRSANVNLPTGTWKAGTNVTYSVNLYEDNYLVFVKVTVASWGTNQSGGTIIIK